jgi:hypothetical protein
MIAHQSQHLPDTALEHVGATVGKGCSDQADYLDIVDLLEPSGKLHWIKAEPRCHCCAVREGLQPSPQGHYATVRKQLDQRRGH